jgi:hypothetical protein
MASVKDQVANGHISAAGKVFGVPLEVLMSRSNQKTIPTVVREMILSLQRSGCFFQYSEKLQCFFFVEFFNLD